jgi:hypothetical protein
MDVVGRALSEQGWMVSIGGALETLSYSQILDRYALETDPGDVEDPTAT